MKLLIFLSLFFYQTLHANILYPLPAHKFDFSTSAYKHTSSNPSKKRTVASVITKSKTFIKKLLAPIEAIASIESKNKYLYKRAVRRDLEGVEIALKLGANPIYVNLSLLFKNNSELTETEQKIIEVIKKAQSSLGASTKDYYLYKRVKNRDLKGVKIAFEIGANPTEVILDSLFKDNPELTETEQKIIEVIKEAQYTHKLNYELSHGVRTTDLDKVIEYLKKGADPNIRHYKHASHLLQLALRSGYLKKFPLIEEHEKIVEALLKHGADPNLYAKDLPPLHLAVFFRNPKIVKLLIKYGANVNFKYNNDVTPLLLVVNPLETEKNFEQYVKIYSKNEIEFRSKDHLELNKEITQALLDAGANINEKTLGGKTLLVNAAAGGKPDFAAFLIEKGANLEEAIKTIKAYQSFLKNENISLKSSYLPAANILKNEVQLSILQTSLQLFELQKSIDQRFKNREIKSPENDNKKPSCPGAFG